MTLEDLGITGAYDGVYDHMFRRLRPTDAEQRRLLGELPSRTSACTASRSRYQIEQYQSTASYRIDVYGANAVIDSNTVQNVPQYGISLSSTGGEEVTNNVFCDAGVGLSISGSGTTVQVGGKRGLFSHAQRWYGLYRWRQRAGRSGNDQRRGLRSQHGLRLHQRHRVRRVPGGRRPRRSTCSGNSTGIVLGNGFDSSATASDNRVYENGSCGIFAS